MDIEVRIRGLMMDPATNMPIVVLKDVASEAVLPMTWRETLSDTLTLVWIRLSLQNLRKRRFLPSCGLAKMERR